MITEPGLDDRAPARVAELAQLEPIRYERIRAQEAEAMGVRVQALDDAVGQIRKAASADSTSPVEAIEAWPEGVEGVALLEALANVYSRHLVLPPHAATTAALWIAHTYAIDIAHCSPLLTWQSPTHRCGKTTAEAVTHALAARAIMASNISPAAVYRFVDRYAPTLILDEADTFTRENEQLRGILNCGHTRAGAHVIRCHGTDFDARTFSAWCPKSLALIGRLPVTLQDRSIIIPMKRKLPGEYVDALPESPQAAFKPLRRQTRRWVDDNVKLLRAVNRPPTTLPNDRAADNWWPLMQIAEVAGGDWPARARAAAMALSSTVDTLLSVGQQLLQDIQQYFAGEGKQTVRSRELAGYLRTLEGRPWPDWSGGRSISPQQIARLLADFGVQPRTIRFTPQKDGTDKGYERAQFEEAFARYLPGDFEPETPSRSDDPEAAVADTTADLAVTSSQLVVTT